MPRCAHFRACIGAGQDQRHRRARALARTPGFARARVQDRCGLSRSVDPRARERCAGLSARSVDGRRIRCTRTSVRCRRRGGSDPRRRRDGFVRRRAIECGFSRSSSDCRCSRSSTARRWRRPSVRSPADWRTIAKVCSCTALPTNRVGGAYHAQLLRESLPSNLQWLGALPRDAALALPERHLGLVAAHEVADLDQRLDALADAWSLHAATTLPPCVSFPAGAQALAQNRLRGRRIAVARDAAFCFLYPANLDLLRAEGRRTCVLFAAGGRGAARVRCGLAAGRLSGIAPARAGSATRPACSPARACRCRQTAARRMRRACCSRSTPWPIATATAPGWPDSCAATRRCNRGWQRSACKAWICRKVRCAVTRFTMRRPRSMSSRSRRPRIRIARRAGSRVYRLQRLTASFVHFYFPSNPDARDTAVPAVTTAWVMAIAVALDAWIGEPRRAHPLVAFGRLAGWMEKWLYRDKRVVGVMGVGASPCCRSWRSPGSSCTRWPRSRRGSPARPVPDCCI